MRPQLSAGPGEGWVDVWWSPEVCWPYQVESCTVGPDIIPMPRCL